MTNSLNYLLSNELDQFNVKVSKEQLTQLNRYFTILKNSPRKSFASWENDEKGIKIHLRDSLYNFPLDYKPDSFLDIGSGAGLPGLIYAILWSKSKALLLDSRAGRVAFLEETVTNLGLEDRVQVICARAEELAHSSNYREKFDFVTARALAKMPVFLELSVAFIKPEGYLQFIRGINDMEEIDKYHPHLSCFQLIYQSGKTYQLGDDDLKRWSAIYQKHGSTPKIYPRKIKKMAKL